LVWGILFTMNTIFLIGSEHKYQELDIGCSLEDGQAFQNFLLQVCRQYDIKTVAEELNEEALKDAKKHWEDRKNDLESNRPHLRPEVDGKSELKRCEEALKWHKKGMSVPQRVAKELSLKPLFCDPDGKQRESLGIEDETAIEIERDFERRISADEADRRIRESRTKRERYWLGRLEPLHESQYPVSFICGADHVNTFSRILKKSNFNVERINRHWKP